MKHRKPRMLASAKRLHRAKPSITSTMPYGFYACRWVTLAEAKAMFPDRADEIDAIRQNTLDEANAP